MINTLVTALVLVAVLAAVLPAGLPRQMRRIVLLLALAVLLAPWPSSPARWLWSFSGPLSLTSALLALGALVQAWGGQHWLPPHEKTHLYRLLAVFAPVFYVFALGFSAFDPYAFGYGDFRFSTALLLLGLWFWVGRAYALCLWLVSVQLAWRMALLPSDNLWDYLFDPWLVGYAVVMALRSVRQRTPVSAPSPS